MVVLSSVQASNASAMTSLPPGLVAVFVGATSGIGRTTLVHLARRVRRPRLYFVGRSQQAADSILRQLRQVNAEGEYHFISADISLLREVDRVCASVCAKEKHVNILFQSQGTLDMTSAISLSGLVYYSRMRFINNLLPLLQRAPSIARVITVMAGTKEGPIVRSQIGGSLVLPWKARGHLCSMMTLTLEQYAERAPNVSFIHDYPGYVQTPLSNSMKGVVGFLMKMVFYASSLLTSPEYIPLEECGERHVFLATSRMYPARHLTQVGEFKAEREGMSVAKGTDGVLGSGVYSVDELCEAADARVQTLLRHMRANNIHRHVFEHLEEVFSRVRSTAG